MQHLAQEPRPHRERYCIHRDGNAAGDYYRGDTYVNSLQRARGPRAYEIAQGVGPFFWADAPHMRVWLCGECAQTLSVR